MWNSVGVKLFRLIEICSRLFLPLESTMFTNLSTSDQSITLSYKYQKDEEFVFSRRGQTFAVLVPGDLPLPTSNLIDLSLANDMKLKISNLKCQKYSYGGFNMRIVGQVTTHVQCIKDGYPVGKIHFTASVVRGLSTNLDTDSVAGTKLARLLSRQECRQIPDVPETICDTIEKEECKDVSKLPLQLPEDAKLPPQLPRVDTTTPPTARDATTTPPADNCHDDAQHEGVGGRDNDPPGADGGRDNDCPSLSGKVQSVAVLQNLSPHDANMKVFNITFGHADFQPDPDIEMDTLFVHNTNAKIRGQLHRDPHRQFRFIRDDNLVYSSQHGRNKCSRSKCSLLTDVPHNCAFHPQWLLPDRFEPCGQRCQSAFCYCIRYLKPNHDHLN